MPRLLANGWLLYSNGGDSDFQKRDLAKCVPRTANPTSFLMWKQIMNTDGIYIYIIYIYIHLYIHTYMFVVNFDALHRQAIKLKTWTRQPVPMISKHSAHLTPLSVDFRTWLWRYTCLLLLISMLWHRQAIFKSKGDKLCSSAECRIWTRGPRHQIASRLNARWQTDWAIEDQAKNLNSTARPYDQQAFSPLDPTVSWLSHLALAINMFVVVNFDTHIYIYIWIYIYIYYIYIHIYTNTYYSEVKWASWGLKSPGIRMFV